MCRALNTPVTGGNVSFHNESQQHAVFPTPTIGMLGLIDDVTTVIGNSFTSANEHIILVGWQRSELGGSEYLKTIKGRITGEAPYIDADEEVRLQRAVLAAIRMGYVTAAHDCAEGGLLVTLVEMTIGKGLGATVNIPFDHHAGHVFGEAQSRIILSVPESSRVALLQILSTNDVPHTMLGTTGGTQLVIDGLLQQSVSDLRYIYENALPIIMAN